MKCLIIGTGDMAHALAMQFERTLKGVENSMKVASPTRAYAPNSYFHDTDIPFVDLNEGIEEADVIVLAIPGRKMASFVAAHADEMKHALIIDINNDPNAQEGETFDRFDLRWVKGFNDCGAVDLLTRKSKGNPKTRLSGRNASAMAQAKTFAQEVMGFEVQATPHARRMGREQDHWPIGDEWKNAACIGILFYIFYTLIVAFMYYKRWPFPYSSAQYPVKTQNKVMSSTALTLFALSVIPGTVARIIKSWRHDSMYRLHPWIVWSLAIRKHVGLVGLWFLGMHAVMSLVEFSPASYYWAFYDSPEATSMNIIGEVSMMFAIYSTSFYCIVGLASLPSVGEHMNKAQWEFVFGPVVWLALACGQIHCVVIYFAVVQGTRKFYGGIPHVTILSSILPWFAFFMKFLQIILAYVFKKMKASKTYSQRGLNTTTHTGWQSKHSAVSNLIDASRKSDAARNKQDSSPTNSSSEEHQATFVNMAGAIERKSSTDEEELVEESAP